MGGSGASGGNGGSGGAGAGGTVMVEGSTVSLLSTADISVLGGAGIANGGRFVLAANSVSGAVHGVGGSSETYTGPTTQSNLMVETPDVPNIADLTGGVAAPYGILANLTAGDSSLSAVVSGAPKNAMAAIIVNGTGLPGYSDVFPGYQWVFVVNLQSTALAHLMVGLGTTSGSRGYLGYASAEVVQAGGFNIASVAATPQAGQIFAFLAPTADINSGWLSVTAQGASELQFQPGYFSNAQYLMAAPSSVPDPGTLAITIACGSLLLLKRRRSRKEVK
jgi:hypothetical protein